MQTLYSVRVNYVTPKTLGQQSCTLDFTTSQQRQTFMNNIAEAGVSVSLPMPTWESLIADSVENGFTLLQRHIAGNEQP